ncbi:hypothetical protein P5673_004705 [Acropora cervicornis]|uniref:Uncharacterized protein n=1 Tax=Acropora cervicornis TaxID=6130 RepID=A0AAD9R0W0_ACRCE|nr:hypothetical protein P5673_004705 [Acropora cervicornis]
MPCAVFILEQVFQNFSEKRVSQQERLIVSFSLNYRIELERKALATAIEQNLQREKERLELEKVLKQALIGSN